MAKRARTATPRAGRPTASRDVYHYLRPAYAAAWQGDFARARLHLLLARKLEPWNPQVDVSEYVIRSLANDVGPHTWTLKARHRDMRTERLYQYLLQRFDEPVWDGQPIPAQRLLVWGDDQGYGDVLQWVRLVPAIRRASHATLFLEVPPGLTRLFNGLADAIIEGKGNRVKDLWGRSRGIAYQRPAGEVGFDMHIPFDYVGAVLPLTPEIMRAPYLHAEPELLERWAPRFADRTVLHVGVHVSVEASHVAGEKRTISIESLKPFMDLPGIRFYYLNPAAPELVEQWPGIVDLSHEDDPGARFCQTAAIVSHLDAILGADSSLAHLAGGMGIPVFLLLPKEHDPRWGLQPSTPWYPNHRLFRQKKLGQWDDVVEEAQKALAALGPGSSQAQ